MSVTKWVGRWLIKIIQSYPREDVKTNMCIEIRMTSVIYINLNPLMHNVPYGQTHFKNLAVNAARLKCVWPFWDIMH